MFKFNKCYSNMNKTCFIYNFWEIIHFKADTLNLFISDNQEVQLFACYYSRIQDNQPKNPKNLWRDK